MACTIAAIYEFRRKQDRREIMANELPNLVVPRAEAAQKIKAQIEKGHEIKDLSINSQEDLERVRAECNKWSDYNRTLLNRLFDNDTMSEEYSSSFSFSGTVLPLSLDYSRRGQGERISQNAKFFKEDVVSCVSRLESVLERLELIPEPESQPISSISSDDQSQSLDREVFIVHGRDEGAKESVKGFIKDLDLVPIILHEQPNAGRTIIEKLEDESIIVSFAIVLLTPDDIGYPKDRTNESKPRARQNVIFELGYFIGKLGRSKVCALYKEGVEIPSDFKGVVYLLMGSGDGWKLELGREIKNAGIEIDLNMLFK